jgi:hypothetical protein
MKKTAKMVIPNKETSNVDEMAQDKSKKVTSKNKSKEVESIELEIKDEKPKKVIKDKKASSKQEGGDEDKPTKVVKDKKASSKKETKVVSKNASSKEDTDTKVTSKKASSKQEGGDTKVVKDKKASSKKESEEDQDTPVSSKKASSKKVVKDKNAPNKPKHAYNYFVASVMDELRKENPGKKVHELMAPASIKWKELSEDNKKVFEDKAAKDKERFNNQMASYVPPTEELKKPKRIKFAYNYFASEEMSRLKLEHPNEKQSVIMAMAGANWQKLTDEDKQKYVNLEDEDRVRYDKELSLLKSD